MEYEVHTGPVYVDVAHRDTLESEKGPRGFGTLSDGPSVFRRSVLRRS